MSTTPFPEPGTLTAVAEATPLRPYFADLYTFDWTQFSLRTPLVCSIAVALCLFIGVLLGHPGAALIAGGGAFTIGFGVNQRIADSRLWPMIAGSIAISISTIIGMSVGHSSYLFLAAAALWSFVYGMLTTRAPGIAWVGQQSAITLFVTSAFPASPRGSLERALVILAGGALQTLITTISLKLLPELKQHLIAIPRATFDGASTVLHRSYLLEQLRSVPSAIPAISKSSCFGYAIRITITIVLSAELYRRLGVQSGYWIPMTALLVQKPAFFETLNRALMRISGTIAGAVLCTFFLAHVHPNALVLAALATFFAFLSFATNSVNYGLFSLFITSYIVFLLSLNFIPGPVIAHRRALCTIAGGLIALLIHLDALRRHRSNPPPCS